MAVKKPVSHPKATASQPAAALVPLEAVALEDGPGSFEEIAE